MISHGTINLYTAALLSFLRKVKIEYLDENRNLVSKNIPIMYSSKEKAKSLEFFDSDDFVSGNVNLLPRGTLALVSIMKREDALLNRNIKINKVNLNGSFEYSYNSVPFSFVYEFNIFCRGMSELTSLIEIIMPKFNPNLSLDVYDVANLDEPSRVPLKLMDVTFSEVDEFSETSKNIWNLTFSMQIDGNLYQNIKRINPILEYNTFTSSNSDFKYIEHINNTIYSAHFKNTKLVKGENSLKVIFKTALDLPEITWSLSNDITFKTSKDKSTIYFDIPDTILENLSSDENGKYIIASCSLKTVSDDYSITNKFYFE